MAKEKTNKVRYSINWKASFISTLVAVVLLNLASVIWTTWTGNERLSNEGKSKIEQIRKNLEELFWWDDIKIDWNENWNAAEKVVHPWDVIIKKELPEKMENDTVTVHYEVAPNFEDSEAIDYEKYEEIKDSIQAELSRSINETLIWFDFIKHEHEWEKDSTQYSIIINSIEWHSSPEWYKFWDVSLIPWHYENENKHAAEIRAKNAEPLVKQAFQKVVSENPALSSQIDTSSISVSWKELQITQEEYDELDSLRIKLWYPDIVTMIQHNNKWEIADADAVNLINEIINSKRNVVITYTIKWHPNDIFVIPLLFFPILVFKKEKIKDKKEKKKTKSKKRKYIINNEPLPKWTPQSVAIQRMQPFDIGGHNYKSATKWNYNRRRDWRWCKAPMARKHNATGRRNWSRK